MAERDADAELVDALHGVVDREDEHEGLAAPVRGVAGWERCGGAERQVGAGRGRERCSEGCLNVAGAWRVAAAGCS